MSGICGRAVSRQAELAPRFRGLGPSLLGDRPGSRGFHQAASGIGQFDGQGAEDRLPDEGEGPADGDRLALLLFANRHFDDPQAAV